MKTTIKNLDRMYFNYKTYYVKYAASNIMSDKFMTINEFEKAIRSLKSIDTRKYDPEDRKQIERLKKNPARELAAGARMFSQRLNGEGERGLNSMRLTREYLGDENIKFKDIQKINWLERYKSEHPESDLMWKDRFGNKHRMSQAQAWYFLMIDYGFEEDELY